MVFQKKRLLKISSGGLEKKDDYKTSVKISAQQCRNSDTFPNPIGNHKNPYHAEIWDSEDERVISLFKAMKLAQLCPEV